MKMVRSFVVVVAAAVGAMAIVSMFSPAQATMPCAGGYGWMGEYTSTSPQDLRGANATCNGLPNAYWGWSGVNGSIQVPNVRTATSPSMHDLGWVDMSFNNLGPGDYMHIQIGFYTGGLGSLGRYTSWGMYHEVYNANTDTWYQADHGTLANNSSVTYRIQYSGSGTIYYFYDYYNNYLGPWDAGDSTGMPMAMRELTNIPTTVANSDFGSSTAGTNQTLRIMNGSGYQDWDSTLSTRYTTIRDFSTFSPALKYLVLNRYYFFGTESS
jgi:hypothetical protein